LNPKKSEHIIALMDEPDKQLISTLISYYWKDMRKTLSGCVSNNIIIEGLGTFKAKPWKLPEVIKKTECIVAKYKNIVETQVPVTYRVFSILKEYEEKLEKLKALQGLIDEDKLKKEQIKQKRNVEKN
jgi:hypothetical protein